MNKIILNTNEAPAPIGPYNQAVRTTDLLFISGQIPLDASNGALIQGSIEQETAQVMKNLAAILNGAGLDFKHVVKTSIFLLDMADFAKVNDVYGQYFDNQAPARETVQVSGLPKGVRVEISMIASF